MSRLSTTEYSKDKTFWSAWLEKYMELRCLWDVDSNEYTNRTSRADGYKELVNMAKRIHPEADETFVKGRINSFRTTYRKEAKKVLAAKENGTSYEPTWYFYKIMNSIFQLDNNLDEIFGNQSMEQSDLSDGEDPFEMKADFTSNGDIFKKNAQKRRRNSVAHESFKRSPDIEENSLSSFEQQDFDLAGATTYGKRNCQSLKAMTTNVNNNHEEYIGHREPKIKTKELQNRNYQLAEKKHSLVNGLSCKVDQRNNAIQKLEDECDIVGNRVAIHFKNMKPMQRLIAERIICDVCITGRMEQLTWDSGFVASDNRRRSSARINTLPFKPERIHEEEAVVYPEEYQQT